MTQVFLEPVIKLEPEARELFPKAFTKEHWEKVKKIEKERNEKYPDIEVVEKLTPEMIKKINEL